MEKKQETVQIKGLNAELQGLPGVAAQFARLNPSNPDFRQDEELLELNRLSRIYLRCLLNKAIESYGEEVVALNEDKI
ncbi:hypothetical protein KAR91_74855 [Candidatus Pacearchaeota archaeon]|nr:hypothetical protein [Candidatus Pacearchaeota archaeon]